MGMETCCLRALGWAGQGGHAGHNARRHPQPLELPAKVSGSWGKALLTVLVLCLKA